MGVSLICGYKCRYSTVPQNSSTYLISKILYQRRFVIICVGGSLKIFHWSQLIFSYFTHFEDKKRQYPTDTYFHKKNSIYMDS
jgi:hypothetical protein